VSPTVQQHTPVNKMFSIFENGIPNPGSNIVSGSGSRKAKMASKKKKRKKFLL
jgi:hypothetical protein